MLDGAVKIRHCFTWENVHGLETLCRDRVDLSSRLLILQETVDERKEKAATTQRFSSIFQLTWSCQTWKSI